MRKILSFIGYAIMMLIGKTLRLSEVNPLPRLGTHVAYAIWHGEQFIPFFHHRGQGVTIMSSLSKDGDIQSGILRFFGYQPVRGSSSRRAERALVEMIMNAKKGHPAAFAADGPKGPFHKIKPGIVFLAQKAHLPVIPVSSAAKKTQDFQKSLGQI